jgi:O-antigen/teichoic acid export membrane protein
MNGLTPPFQVRTEYDKRHQQEKEKMMRSIFRNLLASILFLLIVLGWFGDSLLSVLIGRPVGRSCRSGWTFKMSGLRP